MTKTRIPTDWKQVKLGEVVRLEYGKPLPDSKRKFDGVYPVYGANGEKMRTDEYYYDKKSIIVGRKGSVGELNLTRERFWPLDVTYYVTFENKKYTLMFLYELLNTLELPRLATGVKPGLNRNEVYSIEVKIPPLPEQEKIVEVLETWDSYLEKLAEAIELKKKVKKGLMEKLLRGKIHLSGFSQPWETKEIGELLDYEQPNNYIVQSTEYSDEYQTPVLTAGKTILLGRTNELTGVYNKLPVIIFDDFTTANKFVTFPFKVKSSAMKFLKEKNSKVNLKFIYEIIQIIKFQVGEHKRNYLSEYQYLSVDIPTIEEQTAIAQILTTADQEIEALEKKKVLIEQQKKFLLNNMVTGRLRLPEFIN